jgi:hypothetical protein
MLMAAALVGVAAARWTGSARRSERAEAHELLFLVTKTQDAFHASHKRYATSFDEIRYAWKDKPLTLASPSKLRGDRYEITMTQPWGPASWLAVATGDLDGDAWPDVIAAVGTPAVTASPVVVADDLTHEVRPVPSAPGPPPGN